MRCGFLHHDQMGFHIFLHIAQVKMGHRSTNTNQTFHVHEPP